MLCRLFCLLFFLAWTAESPSDTGLYAGKWRSPLAALGDMFVSVPGLGLTPWQILLMGLAPICLFVPGATRRRTRAMDAAIAVSAASVAISFLWGIVRGGGAYYGYYQLWRFLTALLVGIALPSVVRSDRDLERLGRTVIAAGLTRAGLCIYFYWQFVHGKMFPLPDYLTSHDDSPLFVACLLVSLFRALQLRKITAWIAAALVWVPTCYAIVLNDRRIAWIELLLALGCVFFMFPRDLRRRVLRVLLPLAPFVVAYVVVGMNSSGPWFAPVHSVMSAGSYADSSSLARQEEIRNLLYTIAGAGNPLFGTGWGMPYQKLTSAYANFDASWTLYLYLPHNSLLGIAVFAGLTGIFGMWIVVPVAAFFATCGHRGEATPVERAATLTALGILPAYSGHCYGDIGLQSLTGSLLLGLALAIASRVAARGHPNFRPRPPAR